MNEKSMRRKPAVPEETSLVLRKRTVQSDRVQAVFVSNGKPGMLSHLGIFWRLAGEQA